jgi:protein TonB
LLLNRYGKLPLAASYDQIPKSTIMETKTLVFRKWDDLVFANRNKSYGAYAIRKAYSNRVMIGWAISKSVVLILLLVAMFRKPEKIVGTIQLPKPGDVKFVNYVLPEKSTPIVRHERRRAETVDQNRTIKVVTTVVEETPTPLVDEPVGSPNGTDTGESEIDFSAGAEVGVTSQPAITIPDEIVHAEVMPVYEGGMEALMKFVKKHLRYPASARRQGIDGTVYVSFVVTGDGIVHKAKIVKGIHVDCDEEVIRVISMLNKWTGGKHNGQPVNVRMVLPIVFRLQ